MVASSVSCNHETEDAMPVQWKRLSEPRGADASAHTYRSETNDPRPRTTRSRWAGWYVAGPRHTVSHNVNTVLLQYAPNLLNIIHIHTGNTNAALNLAVTVLHNFNLKRDTVKTKNDFPTQ